MKRFILRPLMLMAAGWAARKVMARVRRRRSGARYA
jgi:hypothetical protein